MFTGRCKPSIQVSAAKRCGSISLGGIPVAWIALLYLIHLKLTPAANLLCVLLLTLDRFDAESFYRGEQIAGNTHQVLQ